ncbi:MAG TPA: hypothetical protein VHE77_07590 [Dongiaceae bacterium]|nr:hypothetical protein [Dongiaceae bacterium]HVY99875.1 hypothetical protein [Dongiaceae bacterium]
MAFLLSLIGLAGCATAPAEVSPEAAAKLKTVGVISLIGGSLHYEQLSLTAFSNEQFEYPAAAFGIDPFAADCIAKDLAGRYAVRPVRFNPADFADDKITLKDESGALDSGEPIGAVIRAKAQPNDLDAYVVLTNAREPIGNSNQIQTGIGMRRQHRLLWHDYYTHAIYDVTVVDGHTGKLIAQTSTPAWGGEEVDESYWPFDEDNVSADQAKKVADSDKKAIQDSLPAALKSLNLLPQ